MAFAEDCVSPSSGDNPLALSEKIAKCQDAWNQMEKAIKPHADALRKMESDIAAFQARIKVIEGEVAKKAVAITAGERELAGFLGLAGRRIRQFYIRNTINTPMTAFFSSFNVGSLLRDMAYQKSVTNEDKKTITHTVLSVKDLEDKKKTLENERATLILEKKPISGQYPCESLWRSVSLPEQLTGIIASLTAKQREILSEKSGTFQTTVGDVPLADDPASRPDYNPGFSPAFAAFSFGAPHFRGMSQYGAFGRAKAAKEQKIF